MFHYCAGSVLIMPFIAAYFNELFLLPLSPHPHVILHEGFTRSCRIHCFKKRSKTFSLEGEGARSADEGEKEALQRYSLFISKTFSVL